MGQSILAMLVALILGYAVNSSVKIVSGGDEALVERLGQYKRTLKPGFHFISPVVEKVVCVDTTRERVLDIKPQSAITVDNVVLDVDAVVYWRVVNLQKAYYGIDQIENAIANLVLTTFRGEIGRLPMKEIFGSRDEMNKQLLKKLDEATETWGVKVIRVEIQSITPPKRVQEAMELEQATKSEWQAMVNKATGTKEYMKLLVEALDSHPNSKQVLNYLVTEKYLDAQQKLGESDNAKILFMDPKNMTEALNELMGSMSDIKPHSPHEDMKVIDTQATQD
ncbi:MAG: stomatin-like protein [Tychonema bourrellyi B0820]|uniref:Paraslipin n=1 Tax=Tychonema bourrellyi FEM_GT703 TaxID=2040638 RepID=A0A2G4EUN5_9CYAN|nr:stomatin-like protein [Tychonema bourrellyi]MDQ2100512.1 stomatin-like protein [Tychonema bourrellyi B0820]PHX53249.1 paraslipin [Tychonema bourrellyi FEM_GT703]